MKDFKGEIWKEVNLKDIDLKSKYEVSNLGRIKSYAYGRGKILKGTLIEGYPAVRFRTKEEKLINQYVHRLVAKTFLPKPKEGQRLILHLDYDKTNNRADNLQWATRKEQIDHKVKGPNHRKGLVTNSKLSKNQVIEIKRMLKEGKLRKSVIARKFLISHTQLNRIESGANWANVKLDD